VAATFALPEDTTYRTRSRIRPEHRPPPAFRDAPVQAGFFLAGPDGEDFHALRSEGTSRGILIQEVPARTFQTSVEVLEPSAGRAGRYRNGLTIPVVPPDLPVLSELLIVDEGPLPEETDAALRRLRPGDRIPTGEPLLVGWEIWGLGFREETLRYRLSLLEIQHGFFRRAVGAVGLGGPDRPAYLEWEEPGPTNPGPAFRSVSMDLPSLEPGEYLLRLEITAPGRAPLVSERRLQVEEDGGGGEGAS
jgi:hypothetical protein